MIIDATFWVMISFFVFIGLLIYLKIPQKIKIVLDENIIAIKNQIDEADKLKEDAKNILAEHEKKISNSKAEVKLMINKANEEAEKNVIKTNQDFHNLMESRKKNAEERIKQLKNQALKDIKNVRPPPPPPRGPPRAPRGVPRGPPTGPRSNPRPNNLRPPALAQNK